MRPSLMFKSNPFKQQFHRYDGKTIQTLQIKSFSFVKPKEKKSQTHSGKFYSTKQSFNKQPFCQTERNSHQHKRFISHPVKKFGNQIFQSIKDVQICQNLFAPFKNTTQLKRLKNKSIEKDIKSERKKDLSPSLEEKDQFTKQQCQKFEEINMKILLKSQMKIKTKNNQANEKFKLKQKLYKSIDIDNLFGQIQTKVNRCQKIRNQNHSPKTKDGIDLIEKLRKYSKTSNLKARTVFDQFNLNYLIEKKKKFNINENHKQGSLIPYFQSFASTERSPNKAQTKQQISKINKKFQAAFPQIQVCSFVPKKKKFSKIVIDEKEGVIYKISQQSIAKDIKYQTLESPKKSIDLKQILTIERMFPDRNLS